ncbi:putative AAA domain containing protein [Lyophyllum shimeji]|uniref:AAA domain containing protein n=1 Tax=Lyophyllum shimeji TaxID=47721 RepID=A0A9P3UNK3_LYOSH|nr:putative AAA domain containing protein [Lyophyllum shimeji]
MSVTSEPWLEGRVVLILCGLVASGKSTFAEQLERHFPKFRRCNQDDLGDRRQVERLARESLASGQSVCIDRTNFNAAQRSYWIEIAREFPGTSIWVIVFDTPYEICAARLQSRTSHPTIKNPEHGLYVLSRFAADFELPSSQEGYDRIIFLKPADHTSPVYSRSEIAAILRRVHDSTPGGSLLEVIPVGGILLAAILAPVTMVCLEVGASILRGR